MLETVANVLSAREVMGQLLAKAKAMSPLELISFTGKAMEEVKTNVELADVISLVTAALDMKDIAFETYASPEDVHTNIRRSTATPSWMPTGKPITFCIKLLLKKN